MLNPILKKHMGVYMKLDMEPGVSMRLQACRRAVLLVGWHGYLRVSEAVGSGMSKGVKRDGPSGLDVCDIEFGPGDIWIILWVRRAKNDQEMEGRETVVYADPDDPRTCAIVRLRQWFQLYQRWW